MASERLPAWQSASQHTLAPASRDAGDLAKLVEDFLVYGQQRGYSAHTLTSYREAIADFLEFFKGADLRAIRPLHIREWMHWLMSQGHTRNTISARMYAIRAFFDRAVLFDLMPSNPARLIPVRAYKRALPKFLSEDEMRRLIDAAESPRDRAILEVLYATGCRQAECAGMRLEHISWSDRTVRVTGKGNKQRLVPLGRIAIAALRTYVKGRTDGPVFLTKEECRGTQRGGLALQRGRTWYAYHRETIDGKRRLRGAVIGTLDEFPTREAARDEADRFLASKGAALGRHTFAHDSASGRGILGRDIGRIVAKAAKRAGLRHVHPHMLRHSFATHLLEHGADLLTIRDLLGHASISTTQIYASVTKSHMEHTLARCHPRWIAEGVDNETSK